MGLSFAKLVKVFIIMKTVEEMHNLLNLAAKDSEFSKNHKINKNVIKKQEGNIIKPKNNIIY